MGSLSNMQTRVSVFALFFILSVFTSFQSAYSQDLESELEKGDSLFKERKFTQSLEVYESIYENTGLATPAMLLKMAYSQEAMGNLSNALIYLHDYYKMSSDKKVLEKMNELAQVNGLQGYETNDFQQFVKVVNDYKVLITTVLLAFALLILSMIFRKIKKHQEKSPGLAAGLVLVLALIVFFVNFAGPKDMAIITGDDSYVMSGPSAAAELVEVIGQGHKVEVVSKNDIWYQIKWRGETAYIRENNLKELL